MSQGIRIFTVNEVSALMRTHFVDRNLYNTLSAHGLANTFYQANARKQEAFSLAISRRFSKLFADNGIEV